MQSLRVHSRALVWTSVGSVEVVGAGKTKIFGWERFWRAREETGFEFDVRSYASHPKVMKKNELRTLSFKPMPGDQEAGDEIDVEVKGIFLICLETQR